MDDHKLSQESNLNCMAATQGDHHVLHLIYPTLPPSEGRTSQRGIREANSDRLYHGPVFPMYAMILLTKPKTTSTHPTNTACSDVHTINDIFIQEHSRQADRRRRKTWHCG